MSNTDGSVVVQKRKVNIGTSVSLEAAAALDKLAFDTRTTLASLVRSAVYKALREEGFLTDEAIEDESAADI